MLKKVLVLLCLICFSVQAVNAATTASQTISATLTRTPPVPVVPGGGGGTGTGGIVAGGVVGGAAAAGASALAFAPLLLVGLGPNACVCAAAPIDCTTDPACFLQAAIREHGCLQPCNGRYCSTCDKFYFVQNDCDIQNGTYDVDEIRLPDNFKNAGKIKINAIIASQPYGETGLTPDFTLDIYSNISRADLNKKFETQQFLHHYLMKRYEVPLNITCKNYGFGLQKLSGVINTCQLNVNQPLYAVVRYTHGGFRMNLKNSCPKTLTYAYLIEFAK